MHGLMHVMALQTPNIANLPTPQAQECTTEAHRQTPQPAPELKATSYNIKALLWHRHKAHVTPYPTK